MSDFVAGGNPITTYKLAFGLSEKGYDVTVIALKGTGELRKLYKTHLKVIELTKGHSTVLRQTIALINFLKEIIDIQKVHKKK